MLLGEGVGEGLVRPAPVQRRIDPHLVEECAEQRRLGEQTGQPQAAERLEVNLIEGRSQVVAARTRSELPEAVGVDQGELARRAKTRHGIAQVLDLSQARPLAGDPRHQTHDPRISPGALEGQQQFAERSR